MYDDELEVGAVNEVPGEEIEKDDLDESLEIIEEEKEKDAEKFDEDGEFVGSEPEDTDPEDWATPEFTPTGSDIPVELDMEALGESMIEEGDAILDILGPSDNGTFNKLVLDSDATTVSYPDPQDPSTIKIEDGDNEEFEGFGYEPDYTEENVFEGEDDDDDDEEEPIELGEEDLEDEDLEDEDDDDDDEEDFD